MLLNYLDVTKIEADHWFMVELRSEKTSEETIKRVGRALKNIFGPAPAQVFVPVIERDLDTFTLLTECYIFIRADDVLQVAKLRKVTGVQAIMALDDSTRPNKFIRVEDDYVQGLIKQCWNTHFKRSQGIHHGTWVRIIDGETRDMCGSVIALAGDRVMVKIDMKTKPVMVETSIHNLVDLSHVPEAHRVFYYSSPVREFLEDHGTDAEDQIKDDLLYDEEAIRLFLGQPAEDEAPVPVTRHASQVHVSREQTPTRLIKGLIMEGHKDVHEILRLTVCAIRGGVIKTPKTATILWHVLRQTVIRHLFADDPEVRIYTDVVAKYGKDYELTPKDVLKAIPELALRSADIVTVTPAEVPMRAMETVTSVVRNSLAAGIFDLYRVIAKIEEGIRDGRVRPAKHLESFAKAIRVSVLQHFRPIHRDLDIVALADMYSQELRTYPTLLRQRFPTLETLILEKRKASVSAVPVTVVVTDMGLPIARVFQRKPSVVPTTTILTPSH